MLGLVPPLLFQAGAAVFLGAVNERHHSQARGGLHVLAVQLLGRGGQLLLLSSDLGALAFAIEFGVTVSGQNLPPLL